MTNLSYKVVSGTQDSSDTVAWGNFTNSINSTGWSYLEIQTNSSFPDSIQAYAAGYLEAYLTSDLIIQHWQNTVEGYCETQEDLCDRINEFLSQNYNWILNKILEEKRSLSPYWHHVSLFYETLKGLYGGIKDYGRQPLSLEDLYFLNIFGDLEDLEIALRNDSVSSIMFHNDSSTRIHKRILGSGSCSALIKLLPNNSDILFAHDTWASYSSMLRVLKRYKLGFHWYENKGGALIPGASMAFSSYPGLLYSGDDYTLIGSSGLAVMETTIGNSNAELWKYIKATGIVLEGVRATVANRLSKSGSVWASIFSRYNSGTYNNQWMILDLKSFKKSSMRLKKGLLTLLEQLPGHIVFKDVTKVLESQGYWPSYNTPYFPRIFNLSGGRELVAQYGDWFSYDKNPRALIFKRDVQAVTDMNSMIKLMRYNNYKNDPLSACNCTPPYSAENAISARNDLNPPNGTYPFEALAHRSHGGTDMKLSNSELFNREEFVAISGPTSDDLPPFSWLSSDFRDSTRHFGHPDTWNFSSVTHVWSFHDDFFI